MANVSIKFNNKEFLLSCEDGQEEHLEELLIHINQKFNDLKNNLGNLGENKLLLITAVKIMDEYFETKKKIDQKKNELKDLSNKFKELSPRTQKIIIAFAGIVAALGPVIAIIGTLLTMAPAIGAAFTLMMGPVGLIIAGLTAISVVIYKNWAGIKTALIKVGNYFIGIE